MAETGHGLSLGQKTPIHVPVRTCVPPGAVDVLRRWVVVGGTRTLNTWPPPGIFRRRPTLYKCPVRRTVHPWRSAHGQEGRPCRNQTTFLRGAVGLPRCGGQCTRRGPASFKVGPWNTWVHNYVGNAPAPPSAPGPWRPGPGTGSHTHFDRGDQAAWTYKLRTAHLVRRSPRLPNVPAGKLA